MYLLNEWELLPDKRIRAKVYGNPAFTNGTLVITSPVIAQAGFMITTRSGTVYYLAVPQII